MREPFGAIPRTEALVRSVSSRRRVVVGPRRRFVGWCRYYVTVYRNGPGALVRVGAGGGAGGVGAVAGGVAGAGCDSGAINLGDEVGGGPGGARGSPRRCGLG